MLSWEFPPRIVGGIAPHVYNLSCDLVSKGVDVHVVTCDFPGAKKSEEINGIQVLRVDSSEISSPNFATWVYLMNVYMQSEAADLMNRLGGNVDVLHAHDWLVANAAIGLKHIFRVPLVVTIHSTEMGRRNGLHTDYEIMIHQTEKWLSREAWRVVCCSKYMTSHVKSAFGLPDEKVVIIPNGVDINGFPQGHEQLEFRRSFASDDEKIILFVGRLVYEKGVQVLVNAMPKVLAKVNAKFVIVGDGYLKNSLMEQVNRMSLGHKVFFTGFIDDQILRKLYGCADVCVVPSLYEPFGITALEAMAAKVPLVVADSGGLSEIVAHDRTGVKVFPNNADSLAWGITRVLLNPAYSAWIRTNAHHEVLDKYTWTKAGEKVKILYQWIRSEHQDGSWKPTRKAEKHVPLTIEPDRIISPELEKTPSLLD